MSELKEKSQKEIEEIKQTEARTRNSDSGELQDD